MTATTASNGAPNPPEATTSPAPVVADDVVDPVAAREAIAELAAIKAKLADDKKADKDAKKRAQEAAEQAGELKTALEAAKARLAELEGDAPLAGKWRAYEAAESKRLDEEAKALPDAFKALYSKAGDIDARKDVLTAFRAVQPTGAPAAKSTATPPALGGPPSAHEIDFAAAYKDAASWTEAKRRDPKGAAAFVANAGKSPSLLSNLTGGLFGNRSVS